MMKELRNGKIVDCDKLIEMVNENFDNEYCLYERFSELAKELGVELTSTDNKNLFQYMQEITHVWMEYYTKIENKSLFGM